MQRKQFFNSKTIKNTEPILNTDYVSNVQTNSYLGKKGYTIPINVLSKDDLEFLRKELFIKPVVQGINYGPQSDGATAFPVFRENQKKIYLPRFYGIQRYGMVSKNEISNGDNINVIFDKGLRDYQETIVNVYMKHVQQPICNSADTNGGGGILEVPCGRGKCMGRDTPIMLYDGNIKMVQDIKVGDVIMGDDSTPRQVLTLARGKEQMYKVVPDEGDSYIVNESHILSLKYRYDVNERETKGTILDISVLDFLKLPKSYRKKNKLVGYRVPILFPKKEVNIDPYLLGYWLGNGVGATLKESDILKYLTEDCLKKKYIPHEYKCNDRNTQLKLLAGFIDSHGFHTTPYQIWWGDVENERVFDDIIFIARSLGFSAYKSKCPMMEDYIATIQGKGTEEIPVKRRYMNFNRYLQKHDILNTPIKLEKLGIDDYYGFEIDGNRRFVLGDCTVTHNTVMALKIIALLQKKTLIIVHKEFLMNQWIERIAEFIPGTRIGKIQGQVFDIIDKDIVIGMVQTLYNKDYSQNTFSSFGLTIIDEVHRIGSEQFSKTLIKTITPYMLGISATVDRKDQLTRVLYMFIGDKIYTEQRTDDDIVQVRAIKYISNDTDFNTVELDYRGNTKYSTMITKLCAFTPRSNFIIKVIIDLLIENEDKQIMILCHNRSLLTYLYESIIEQNIASVGYYVGGMKPIKLQETETKQIVLATYAMAAEALDIKTLSTLVMVTPKTDITQSVGRILRVKNNNPIIVDIIDTHSIFQNQWTQRKKFYKKCNYSIRQVDSSKYTNMSIDWYTDLTWKRVFDPKQTNTEIIHKSNNNDDDNDDNDDNINNSKCLIDTALFDI